MIIKKFQAKTEEAALELARKELGSGIVVMNVKKVKKKGLFSIFKPQQVEVTVALEEEEKQNFREAVAKVSEIARQSEAAGNTRSAKTEPEQPAPFPLQPFVPIRLKAADAAAQTLPSCNLPCILFLTFYSSKL